jgi:hypothetical protein
MKVVAVITQPEVIDRILRHLAVRDATESAGPDPPPGAAARSGSGLVPADADVTD